VLEAGSGTKFLTIPQIQLFGPFLGHTRNLGARHVDYVNGDQLDHLLLITTLGELTPTLVAMVITSGMLFEKKKINVVLLFSYSYTFRNISLNNETQFAVKAHYFVQKMLSQGNFCKILKFVISYVIKYSQLG
jgi:hypothetical protein